MENEKQDGHISDEDIILDNLSDNITTGSGNNPIDYRTQTGLFLSELRCNAIKEMKSQRKREKQIPRGLKEILFKCPENIKEQEIAQRMHARQVAIDKLLEEHFKDYYRRHPEEYLYSDLDADLLEIVELSYRNGQYAFITLNFNKSKYKQDKVLNILNGKQFNYIERWIACFEYHTKKGEHPHIHMLIEKKNDASAKCTKSKIIADYYRKYGEFLDDKQKVDVRMPKNPEGKLNYILGLKIDDKMADVEEDKKYRKENGLQETYGNWSLDS